VIPQRLHNQLSDLKLRRLKDSGRYTDGLGLHIFVTKALTKQWVLRLNVQGVRREIGLGGYPDVSLSEARATRDRMRAEVRAGLDSVAKRNDSKVKVLTFREAAEQVLALNKASWKNPKHAAQWLSTLETYAFPHIGNRKINDISAKHILMVLEPIWLEKHETANRVRQRMSKVFDWAKAKEFVKHENPVTGIQEGLPNYKGKTEHFKAVSYTRIQEFIQTLQNSTQSINVQNGLQFLILTVVRSGELRFAEWSEIDLENRKWLIPAERMKAGIDHHIPLSAPAIRILKHMVAVTGKQTYIFPSSQNWGKAMSDATMSKAVKALGYDATVHGFRSTFRDWASETRSYPNDVVEWALAHTNPNKTEAAYKRGDLFEKRMKLMEDWGRFCMTTDTGENTNHCSEPLT